MQIGSRRKVVDVEHIVGDVEDRKLREELSSCQHFLVDSELERAWNKIFNYAVETLTETIVTEKLDYLFNNLKCAAKVHLAFGFILKNVEDGEFVHFYAHKNNTPLNWSKFVCTHDDLAKLKDFFNKTDVTESCRRGRMNTKWRFYKLTNLTLFAALLKDVPTECMDAVLPEPLLKNHTINYLTFEENTRQLYNDNLCLFPDFAHHLRGNQRLEEETSNIFNSIINKMDGLSPNQFKGVHMNDIPIVEHLLTLNILLYGIVIVDGNLIGEVARRSLQKYDNTVRLLRYNNHICYMSNINAVSKSIRQLIRIEYYVTGELSARVEVLSRLSARVGSLQPILIHRHLHTPTWSAHSSTNSVLRKHKLGFASDALFYTHLIQSEPNWIISR